MSDEEIRAELEKLQAEKAAPDGSGGGMSTPEQRAEWQQKSDAATPGPWDEPNNPTDDYWAELHPEDKVFVSAARSAVPALLADVAERDELIAQLRAELDALKAKKE